VAHGSFPIGALDAVAAHLDDIFLTHGFKLSGCYWCPHDPNGRVMDYAFECGCRMPLPGLIEAAARDHDLDLGGSWVIGCGADDIEAGVRAGCSTVWIGDEDDAGHRPLPDLVAQDLLDAAEKIMRARDSRSSRARSHGSAWTQPR
jgi:histidinol phosphatase-like enzyme